MTKEKRLEDFYFNQPIEEADLHAAIGCMSGGKAPGPDSLPIDIYNIFPNKLISPMIDVIIWQWRMSLIPTLSPHNFNLYTREGTQEMWLLQTH